MPASHAHLRHWHWPWLPLMAPLSLALLAPAAQGAAFQPGSEADPPTGDVAAAAPSPAEPLRGSGIQWTLAPWRLGGALALDLRALRLEDGRTTRQALLVADLDMASYVWQPWFVQLRLGVGVVAAQAGGDPSAFTGSSGTLTGRAAIMVFPASRFPFELRADFSDSRTAGVALSGDYRSRRLSMSQGWRPETGNANLQLQADYSELLAGSSRDTLATFSASALRQAGAHTLDLGFNHSDHHRDDTGEHTRLSGANARHSYQPATDLNVETLASWNEARLSGGGFDLGSDVRQLSSFATWRGRSGLWAGAGAPLAAATARWVQTQALGGAAGNGAQAFNASLGASQELGPAWRTSASASASHLQSNTLAGGDSAGAQASLSWSPAASAWAGWRYGPAASINGGFFRNTTGAERQTLGLQASHGVSRDLPWGEGSSLSLSLTQSAAVLRESGASELSQALAHGASVSWQHLGNEGGQSYGGLSYSDSETRGGARGRFQLVNLQLSQRVQLSRYEHWAANLTLQGANNRSSELDVFSGQRRELGAGWQRFYTGALSYEHQRAFGVPRLRHTLLLGVNSQPLERRALGDIDAPRERISESLESRLDHAIGRLDTRLALRVARVDGRVVATVQARAQRRF